MRGDSTRYGSVTICPRCGARFAAPTTRQALQLLDTHQAAAGCQDRRR